MLGLIVGAMVLWVFFFFAIMVCGCGRWWFKLRPQDWWLVLSFETSAMEVVGLIQKWRDQVRREEKEMERGLRLNVFVEKKKNGDVAGQDCMA